MLKFSEARTRGGTTRVAEPVSGLTGHNLEGCITCFRRFPKLVIGGVLGLLLLTATPVKADPVPGKIIHPDEVKANSTDSFTVRLRGEETTRVLLSGDGDTCLELRVYDENGNLVASDTRGGGDDRMVLITPRWTGSLS